MTWATLAAAGLLFGICNTTLACPHGPPPPWADELSDTQRAELHQMAQDLRQGGKAPDEVHEAVRAKLESWGVEPPEEGFRGPGMRHLKHMLGDRLSGAQYDELREAIRNLRESGAKHPEIREAVRERLGEWGIELPEKRFHRRGGRPFGACPPGAGAPGPSIGEAPEPVPPDSPLLEAGNHPNPFNPSTEISINLKQTADAQVRIYNLRGQLLCELWSGELAAGEHSFTWDGQNDHGRAVASGTYVYQVEAGGDVISRRMTVIK